MILIVGGKYQGKKELAARKFPGRECISDYEEIVRSQLDCGVDVKNAAELFAEEHLEAVVTLSEIGSGIAPMRAEDRRWREETGRAGCILAENAEQVYRVTAGIGLRLK